MLTLFLNIVVVCFIMSLAAVFVIQWWKNLAASFFEKPANWKSICLSNFALCVSAILANIAYDAFGEYFPKVSSAIQIVLTFTILGFMQLVWENYNLLKDWILSVAKKKIEKEVDKA